MTNLNEELFEEEARVAAIYPIGMMGDTENPPAWLAELHEAVTSPEEELFQKLPELSPHASDIYEWADALFMRGRSGFIVRYEACIRMHMPSPATAWTSGWGYYRFRYIYVETFDEIGPAVLAAVRKQHEASKAKAGTE